MVYQGYGGMNNPNAMSGDQNRKIFLGGLNYQYEFLFVIYGINQYFGFFFFRSTTDETLRAFCSRFGKITDCLVMRNPEGKSRGFGFVTYEGKIQLFKNFINESLCCIDTSSVEDFMRSRPHTIDNRQIDPKRASTNLSCLFI